MIQAMGKRVNLLVNRSREIAPECFRGRLRIIQTRGNGSNLVAVSG